MALSVEWAYILAGPGGAALWAIGGTWKKWVRRFAYPIFLAGLLAVLGTSWWRCIGVGLATSAVSHLGYGDRASWWQRVGVGLCLGCSLLPLACSFALLLPTLTFLSTFVLSRKFNSFPWKVAELSVGFVHSLTAVWLVS